MRGLVLKLSISILLLAPVTPVRAEGDPFALDGAGTVLRFRGKSLKQVSTISPAPEGTLLGNLRVRIQGPRILAASAMDGREVWTADASPADGVCIEATNGGILYCLRRKWDKEHDHDIPTGFLDPGTIQRLSATTGKWLPSVTLPSESDAVPAELCSLLALEDGAVVLSRMPGPRYEDVKSYRLSRIRGEPPAVTWSREVRARVWDHWLSPIWAGFVAGGDGRGNLQTFRKHLFLSVGSEDDLHAFDLDTGEPVWRLDRPGDWERWFIGPSVWGSGISLPEVPGKRTWRVFGGPVAVPYEQGDGTGETPHRDRLPPKTAGYRLFLLVAREKVENRPPKKPDDKKDGEWKTFRDMSEIGETDSGGHNVDPIIYEVNDRGRPVAMATLPGMASDASCQPTGGGVLFLGTERYGLRMAWVLPTFQHDGAGMNGTSQHLARVAWWRHLPEFPAGTPAWRTYRAPDIWARPLTVSSSAIYRVDTGGFIETEADRAIYLPMVRTELATGNEEPLVLHVPFRGSAPTQKFKESYTESEDGWIPDAEGPPPVSIAGLAIVGNLLLVRVNEGASRSAQLAFELP